MMDDNCDGSTATMMNVNVVDRYDVLIEFAHRHLDFQRAELESVFSIYGYHIGTNKNDSYCCLQKSLPSSSKHRPFMILSVPSTCQLMEGEVIESVFGVSTSQNKKKNTSLVTILSQCTLIRSVIELWSYGPTFEECVKSCHDLYKNEKFQKRSCYTTKASWKLTIHTLGSKVTREEQNEMRNQFAFLNFPGPVQMTNPTNEFIIIQEIPLTYKGSPIHQTKKEEEQILSLYFGRILGGQRDWRKFRLEQYTLKKRLYLGPTSMDAELSFIMSNLAGVTKGSFCFDPFVGTGSILLSCALRGAYCFGTDIDIRILRGDNKATSLKSNFDQYNLPRPDLVRSDNAIYTRHYRHSKPLYDAIVTDPPYGIRAGARKCGSKLDDPRPVPEEHRHDHIAQTKPYCVSDVMADLLDVAAKSLVLGGKLVYIIPSMASNFDPTNDLPQHECLQIKYLCYQPLQKELGRRVVCMEKIKDYEDNRKHIYLQNIWKNGPQSAEKVANLRQQLLEAAKQLPGYEQKAAFRKQKRKATRDAKKKAKREQQQQQQQHPTTNEVENENF